jgi:hypothetical protein
LRISIYELLGARAFIVLSETELRQTAPLEYLSPASVLLNNFLPAKEKKTGIRIFSLVLGALVSSHWWNANFFEANLETC